VHRTGDGLWLILQSRPRRSDEQGVGNTPPAALGTGELAGTSSGVNQEVVEKHQPSASLEIPERFQFAGIVSVAMAGSDAELLSVYTPEQQAHIRSHLAAYGSGTFGVSRYAIDSILSFRTREQLQWLVSNGFPMPDDILAAEAMSDEELADLASTGNFKATAFHLDRISQRHMKAVAEASVTGTTVDDAAMLRDAQALEDRLLSEGSAFGAYSIARSGIARGNVGEALAAYSYAKALGDVRATDFARQLEGSSSGESALTALIAYDTLLMRGAQSNPLLGDRAALARRAKFPRF
jgi:hypothetical protein